ncbi:MAG: hypothetical protein WDM89_20720 [Rhizomicrobium sp.]
MKTRSLFVRTLIVLTLAIGVLFLASPFLFHLYFSWHWESEATRKAIYAASQTLMAQAPLEGPDDHMILPQNRWPKTIASLKPFYVAVDSQGVNILLKVYFDDESGYFIPRRGTHFAPRRDVADFYTPLNDGVWWYYYR